MAQRYVNVRTPSGLQPDIPVTLNTPLLKVLETACGEDWDPDKYDLKYYTRILDVNLTIQHANIPNNAYLDMVQCKTPRKISDVTLCVQFGDNRLTGQFSPNDNLDKILNELKVEYDKDSSVMVYARTEILGKDFETVTLKSIGLLNGRACLRLIFRDPQKLKEQAHVYVPPTPKVSKSEDDEIKSKPRIVEKNKFIDPVAVIRAEKEHVKEERDLGKKERIKENENKENSEVKKVLNATDTNTIKEEETSMKVNASECNVNEIKINENIEKTLEKDLQIEFLGERQAVLFNQSNIQSIPHDDFPDEFYQLTKKDTEILLRDVERKKEEWEKFTLREHVKMKKDSEQLNKLYRYPQTIIRIQFPNQFILQGQFSSTEKVQEIKNFVKTYLEHPETDFALYTSPPRCFLNFEQRLYETDLLPSAIVYYSGSSDLRADIKTKLTDPAAVNAHVTRIRQKSTRQPILSDTDDNKAKLSAGETTLKSIDLNKDGAEPQPGPSSTQRSLDRSPPQPSKMPKWLKLSKK